MQRVYDFLRRHPTSVDGFWAVVLLGLCLVWVFGDAHGAADLTEGVLISVALCAAVTLRRRWTLRALLLTGLAGLAQLLLDFRPFTGDVAFLVAIYTVAARDTPRWASRSALAGAICVGPIAQLRWNATEPNLTWRVLALAFVAVPFVLAWVLGDSLRTRRAYYGQLEERAARLEKEREAQAAVAVAAERARIARELHDVVAHNVSVMVVQADGAAYVLQTAPDQARQALQTISTTGRQALAEMRRLLGVLRAGDARDSSEYVPQPDVEQIEHLVEQVRQAGIPVDFTIEGTPRRLPSGVELTAYRIVQEALTNSRKHGGPHVRAGVRLVYQDDGLGLLVEDDGRGSGGTLPETGGADGQGHGLIGMRERVGMVGGTLHAGPRPGGGFRISALLPMKQAT